MLEGVNALFFIRDLSPNEYVLEGQEVKHITKVLRKQEGDDIFLTDGRGGLAQTTISHIGKQKLTLVSKDVVTIPRQKPKITLAFSVLKQPSRMEWMIEKATEYGVAAFQPLYSEHCIRSHFNSKRLETIVLSAMKQSLQCYCPEIHPMKTFEDFLQKQMTPVRLMAYTPERLKSPRGTWPKISAMEDITALVGPEGGFTIKEAEQALAAGFSWVSLGSSRLRAESASLAIIQQIHVFSML